MNKSVLILVSIMVILVGCNNNKTATTPVLEPAPAQAPSLPVTPSDLSTRAEGYGTVQLSWVDSGDNETWIHIERSEDGITFTLIASVAGDIEEYQDIGLSTGDYTYRINASNDEGITEYSNHSQVRLWAVDSCQDTPVSDPALSAGRFLFIPISGLNYTTPNHASFTDSNGNFYFGTAEQTQFYLGYTPVGSISSAPYVRFPDLAVSLGAASLEDRIALNLLSLLQTLDSDNDAFNGIQIPCTVSQLPYREIDFTLHESNFMLQPAITEMLAGKSMVSNATARDTYETLRKRYYAGTYGVGMTFYLDGYLPLTFAFSMTVNELGELTLNNLDLPYDLFFDPATGVFTVVYTDLEPLLIYFILKYAYGLDLNLGDLPQYYPLLLTMYGTIQPDHTVRGESVLYTLSGEYTAEMQGVRQ